MNTEGRSFRVVAVAALAVIGTGCGRDTSVAPEAQTEKVRVSRINQDGSREVIATTEVEPDGEYALPCSCKSSDRLIADVLDVSGQVTGSVIVDVSKGDGQKIFIPAVNAETGLEVEVLAELAASGARLEDINTVELRARIDADAAALGAALDAKAKVKALAAALKASQKAALEAYAKLGVQVTAKALYEASLDAALELNAALCKGVDVVTAEKVFLKALAEVEISGCDESGKASVEAAASLAFRTSLKAALEAVDGKWVDATLRATARLQAECVRVALEAILKAQAAASATIQATIEACEELVVELDLCTSEEDVLAAFEKLSAEVTAAVTADASVQTSGTKTTAKVESVLGALVGAAK